MTQFPKKDFLNIDTGKINPEMFEEYGECKFFPIINDEKGQRWLCHFKKGFKLESHNHPGRYEWFVISGKMKIGCLEDKREEVIGAGGYYVNPPNKNHYEECLEDAEVLWIYNMSFDPHNH